MWSRKGKPVATLTRPWPPITTFAVSLVSLLALFTADFLFTSHLDCMRVPAETLHGGEPHARFAQDLQVAAVQAQHACPLEERVHAERRGEPRRARRGKRVVGTRRVIAERHRRVLTDE